MLFVLFFHCICFTIIICPHYDSKYLSIVVVCYDRKILGLVNSKLQQQQFLAYRLISQKQVVGRGGHLGISIATTQHIIYTSKNSKSIYHTAAPLHRVVRNIGAPTLSCQKAACSNVELSDNFNICAEVQVNGKCARNVFRKIMYIIRVERILGVCAHEVHTSLSFLFYCISIYSIYVYCQIT